MTKRQATNVIKRMSPQQRRQLRQRLPEMKLRNEFLGWRIDQPLLKHVEKKLQEVG